MVVYSIAVRIDGIESRRRSAGLLHIVMGLFLIVKTADYYRLTEYRNFLPVIPVLLAGSFSLFYGLFRRMIDFTYRYNYGIRLLQVVAFTLMGAMLLPIGRTVDYVTVFIFAFLALILMFTERRIFQETSIFLHDDGITIPGYYREHVVKWNELSNVVVREDFITIFHIKKKYLQYQIQQDLSLIEIAKMNAFCSEKIGLLQSVEPMTEDESRAGMQND